MIYQLKSLKNKGKNTSPILEIRIGKFISGGLEKYFDQILIEVIEEKRLVTFGKENIRIFEHTQACIDQLFVQKILDYDRFIASAGKNRRGTVHVH